MDTQEQTELPSYTPEEERLIIRNKNGVPVGIRPHHKWTPKSIAVWAVVTALGVLGWWMLAVVRGKSVNTIWFVVTAICYGNIGSNRAIAPYDFVWQYQLELGCRYSKRKQNRYTYIRKLDKKAANMKKTQDPQAENDGSVIPESEHTEAES